MTATHPTIGSLLLLPFALAAACSTPPPQLNALDYPGELQPPANFPAQAVWQQRVVATWQPAGQPAEQRGFDAAVQRQGDTLTVIGLSPMGSVGFSIEQSPDDIQIQNRMPTELAIPPRFILLDVQRTFFPWLGQDLADGETSKRSNGEEITERWLDGRIVQRTFRRLDDQPAGEITIRYDWQRPDWSVPSQAVLDNGWFGYQLTITTHSETVLQEAPLSQAPAKAAPRTSGDSEAVAGGPR